ncbi:LOW QUALITY PROTEIN: X-box-binding protein 1 [Electrophorus electricus]|uniref:LOW QUALITY PROTEIN: X-box-binding protein 1 n=1 Tax=Electrophorus electricus TaxID=8005 RepID=UPI0015CF992C|nr:LOW QUALITY PROTEIN: X-box-binding protein 1 [Electrophorus electricus]
MVVVAAGAGGAHKVLLISGKQSAEQTGYSRALSVVLPRAGNQTSSDSDCNASTPPLRKRQRLTHLSPEEKALRRKLKNRVAAQTARDRKKAKMGELEQQVLELEQENQKLHLENRMLREKASDLLSENEELRQRLGLDTLDAMEKVQAIESGAGDLVLVTGSSECSTQATCASAAGAGPVVIKAEDLAVESRVPGTADTESDLLLGILDILDTELFLKGGAPEAQEAEQHHLLVGAAGEPVPASLPEAVGATPVKLEALNELIQFDHVYTKQVEVVHEESVPGLKTEEVQDPVAFSSHEEEIEVEVEMVNVKDEPEEVVIPGTKPSSPGVDDFLSEVPPSFSDYEKVAYLITDACSDSGYERSSSPFSDMSSPLCSDSSWEDMFASELFPQLISV